MSDLEKYDPKILIDLHTKNLCMNGLDYTVGKFNLGKDPLNPDTDLVMTIGIRLNKATGEQK